MSNPTDADVIVIGAGPSGSYAAKLLHDQGVKVKLVEAKDRVGGRTWSSKTEALGGPIDFGGQWIGETHVLLPELGAELGLETVSSVKPGNDLFVFNGDVVVGDEDQAPSSASWTDELARSFELLDEEGARLGWAEPWASPHVGDLDTLTVAQWLDQNVQSPEVRMIHEVMVNILNGASTTEVSMAYWAYFVHQGEGIESLIGTRSGAQVAWFIGGMGQVTELIADKLGDDVHLNWPVTRIEQDQTGVTVFSGERKLAARFAILATPPSAGSRVIFEPPLPAKRAQLQARAPMGRLAKIQVRYDEPFWQERGLSGAVFECGDLAFWLFDGSKPTDSLATIVGFIGGKHLDVWHSLSSDEREKRFIEILVNNFGQKSREVRYVHETDWTVQPWTGGAPVTFMPTGLLSSAGSALREPAGRIHFAGTEAAPMWSGYIEGALRAGKIAAADVLGRLV
ncbi:flavin monoamine oxidase family protein [Nocardioides sp.]|jgi:monoamine oxidase|uniref:flavin monoamine oxidase family protein n=2 Tax=Bacteria TaxID=2 RepID=UPI003510E62A